MKYCPCKVNINLVDKIGNANKPSQLNIGWMDFDWKWIPLVKVRVMNLTSL